MGVTLGFLSFCPNEMGGKNGDFYLFVLIKFLSLSNGIIWDLSFKKGVKSGILSLEKGVKNPWQMFPKKLR